MKHIQLKSSVISRAIQLKENNFYEVFMILMSEASNVQSMSSEPLIGRYTGDKMLISNCYENINTAGIMIQYIGGTYLKVSFFDWIVVSEVNGVKTITVYDQREFHELFDINKNDIQGNNGFNMSLLGSNAIQEVFENPNDYRLFTYIANVYCNQLPNKGVKNNIIELKTNAVMGICRMSDKTFRKSRNNLVEMGVIYPSYNGYKISFETLNKIVSK